MQLETYAYELKRVRRVWYKPRVWTAIRSDGKDLGWNYRGMFGEYNAKRHIETLQRFEAAVAMRNVGSQ